MNAVAPHDDDPVAVVRNLRVEVAGSGAGIVEGLDLDVAAGEVLAMVGESGSGKTTAGLALLGHVRRGARIVAGSVVVAGQDVLALDEGGRRRMRGRLVTYVPQDPAAALNPALRIGTQLSEVLHHHGDAGDAGTRRARVAQTLREVLLPDDPAFLRRYPHQLSGGQQQRVVLAMAFAGRPRVIVLDEPTTGLDVTTQAHVLRTVRDLTRTHGASALYVSHDLAVVAGLADRVAVMYAGRIVEQGPAREVFDDPGHPYTRRLLAAVPSLHGADLPAGIPGRAPQPGARPPGCAYAPRCTLVEARCRQGLPPHVEVTPGHTARCVQVDVARGAEAEAGPTGGRRPAGAGPVVLSASGLRIRYGPVEVVHGMDLELARGECLAVVGESGSGKTTLARTLVGLHGDRDGTLALGGEPLAATARRRTAEQRRRLQYVFQNPYGSLHPRRTVGHSVRRPLALLRVDGADADRRVAEILERVQLTASHAHQYPDELSGGERQRVAIARALVCEPDVLVCDEVTSALDVSVQATVVGLLAQLRADLGLSLLFITHDLPLVRSLAHRVVVMQHGTLVETGSVDEVIDRPGSAYTRRLLADTPQVRVGQT